MVSDRVAKELISALNALKGERDQLSRQIDTMESLIGQLGPRRGPGRPKGSGAKRGPGRPRKDEGLAPIKRGPGRPKGSKNVKPARAQAKKAKKKWSPQAREAARARMKAYWEKRKKKGK